MTKEAIAAFAPAGSRGRFKTAIGGGAGPMKDRYRRKDKLKQARDKAVTFIARETIANARAQGVE